MFFKKIKKGFPRVEIEDLSVLLSYLETASLTALESDEFERVEIDLAEPVHKQANLPSNPPVWNGYSGSGDVTGIFTFIILCISDK